MNPAGPGSLQPAEGNVRCCPVRAALLCSSLGQEQITAEGAVQGSVGSSALGESLR